MQKEDKMKAAVGILVVGLLLAGQAWAPHPPQGVYVDGWITGTDDDPIPGNTFRVVMHRNGRVSSTNPGGFLYWVSLDTDVVLTSATITASIPADFDLHSGKPVKVYMDGMQVYNGSSLSYTAMGVPAGGTVLMRIHLKYGLIGDTVDPSYFPQTYGFDASFSTSPAYTINGSAYTELTAYLD
jgi:hypothetical protein